MLLLEAATVGVQAPVANMGVSRHPWSERSTRRARQRVTSPRGTVKSFSQFKNDFANVDTFYVSLNNAGIPNKQPASNTTSGGVESVVKGHRCLSGNDDDKKSG
ncbi:hypothetical protein Hamer_G001316, partial [Homarus americanus]